MFLNLKLKNPLHPTAVQSCFGIRGQKTVPRIATNTTFYSGPQTRSNQRFNNLWCSRLCQQGAQTMVVLWTPSRDTWSTMYSLPWRYSCSKTAAPCTAEQNDKTQGSKQKITRNNKRLQHSNQPTCPQTLSRTISRSLATILPTTQASLNIPPNLRATLPLWAHQQVEVSLRLSHQNLLFVEREHFQVAIRAKVPRNVLQKCLPFKVITWNLPGSTKIGLFKAMAKLDTIRTSRFHRLHDDGKGFGAGEMIHLLPRLTLKTKRRHKNASKHKSVCLCGCLVPNFVLVLCKKEMFNVSSWGGGKKEPKVTQNFCYGFDFSYHTRSVQPEGQMPLQHPAAPVCPVDSAYHVLWCCHANPCTRTRHLPPEQGPPSKKAYFDNEPFTKIGGFWYHFDIFRFICFFLLSVDLFPLDFFSPVKPDPPGPWHQFHHHKSRPQVPHLLPCVQPLLSTPGSPVHRPGSNGSHSNPLCQSRRLNYWTKVTIH